MPSFAEALSMARRKARQQGRPLSATETAGVASTYAEENAARALGQRQMEQQAYEFSVGQKNRAEDIAREQEAEKEAASLQKNMAVASGVGALAGGAVGYGNDGGAIGAAAGASAGAGLGPLLYYGWKAGEDVVSDVTDYARESYSDAEDWVGDVASGDGCIIVTACTDRYSYEVDITRQFRDNYLGPITLEGYYKVASYVVPVLNRFSLARKLVKTLLVDRLIDYGEFFLGYKGKCSKMLSKPVSDGFLFLCRVTGYYQMLKRREENANN